MCFYDKNLIIGINMSECIDSEGRDAVKVLVEAENTHFHTAVIPLNMSKISLDKNELWQINQSVVQKLKGYDVYRQSVLDKSIYEMYITSDKNLILGRCLLGVSMAVTRIASCSTHRELFEYLGGISGNHLPHFIFPYTDGNYWISQRKDSLKDDVKTCRNICIQLSQYEHNYSTKEIKNETDLAIEEWNENGEEIVWINSLECCSVSEIIQKIRKAKAYGKIPVLMGENFSTEDSYLADLAVGLNLKYVSFGKPILGANNAKYNRLIEIESMNM